MNRPQAIALLKKIVAAKIIEPSWVSIEKTGDVYKLKIKCTHDVSAIERFCAKNHLVMEEQDDFYVISKP